MRKAVRKKIGEETMRFLRGNYALDEVGNDRDEVAFRDGDETLLTIFIRNRSYDFQIGAQSVRVTDMKRLEEAKKLILAAKEPNRRPFPKENAVYAKCGHRCDLCPHYSGNVTAPREKLGLHCDNVYNGGKTGEWPVVCPGCGVQAPGKPHPCMNGDSCWQLKCAAKQGLEKCQDCPKYTVECSPGVGYRNGIEPRSISADDVTWAILPFVSGQYGN